VLMIDVGGLFDVITERKALLSDRGRFKRFL
jgi:hypothetical protein